MAEIRLNKALYDENTPGTPPTPPSEGKATATAAPRPAKPMLVARIGAIIVDILLLHLVLSAVARFAHPYLVHLGSAGPWLGLLIGFLYFAITNSSITGGRTAGKFAMRLRASETAGPDLPFSASAKRSLLLLWPVAVYIAFNQITEAMTRPEELQIVPVLGLIGPALMFGWYLGNIVHAAVDPHGRTWYDHKVASVVVTSDCTHETLQEFLRDVRETSYPDRQLRARRYLWGIVLGVLVIVGVLSWQQQQRIQKLSPEEKSQFTSYQKALLVPGFGQPMLPQRPSPEIVKQTATQDTQTSGIWFQYLRRGPVDAEAVKSNPRASQALDRIISEYQTLYRTTKAKNPETQLPTRMQFYVSYGELTNLLFASYARDVVTFSKIGELETPTSAPLSSQEPTSPTLTRSEAPATTPTASAQSTTTPAEQTSATK